MPKISQLPVASAVNDVDNFIIEQSGETKRAPTTVMTDGLNAQIQVAVEAANNAASIAQDAVANMPLSIFKKTYYVDEVGGLDTNEGTFSKPFKTLKKAIDMVPEFGEGVIRLASDIVINEDISATNKNIMIKSTTSTKRVITVQQKEVDKTGNGVADYLVPYSLQALNTASVLFQYCDIVVPESVLVDPAYAATLETECGFIRFGYAYGVGVFTVQVSLSDVTVNNESVFAGTMRVKNPYDSGYILRVGDYAVTKTLNGTGLYSVGATVA